MVSFVFFLGLLFVKIFKGHLVLGFIILVIVDLIILSTIRNEEY